AVRSVRSRGHGKADDIRAWPRSRVSGHAAGPIDCARYRTRQIQVHIGGNGNREESRVPDEYESGQPSAAGGRKELGKNYLGEQAMPFLSKKHLSRRTILRGAGTALALPLLDSMIPSGTALAQTAATPKPRFVGLFVPHGMAPGYWVPEKEGALPESL